MVTYSFIHYKDFLKLKILKMFHGLMKKLQQSFMKNAA